MKPLPNLIKYLCILVLFDNFTNVTSDFDPCLCSRNLCQGMDISRPLSWTGLHRIGRTLWRNWRHGSSGSQIRDHDVQGILDSAPERECGPSQSTNLLVWKNKCREWIKVENYSVWGAGSQIVYVYVYAYASESGFLNFFILLTHEEWHREVYRKFRPSDDIFRRSGAKGYSDHRFRAHPQPTLPANC